MPLFEFECNACKHHFEELVLSSSKTVEECPKCHEKDVRKLVSAGSIRAGGGGYTPSVSSSASSCSTGG